MFGLIILYSICTARALEFESQLCFGLFDSLRLWKLNRIEETRACVYKGRKELKSNKYHLTSNFSAINDDFAIRQSSKQEASCVCQAQNRASF